MKGWAAALFWKEWRESLVAVLSAAALTFGITALAAQSATASPDLGNALIYSPLLWPVFALVAAAPTFAGEMRDGTLPFLTQLPISRAQIWGVKAAAAAGRWALCVAVSLLTWLLLCVVYLRVTPMLSPFDTNGQWLPPLVYGLSLAAAGLGVGLLLSPLINSSAIVGVAAFSLVAAALALYDRRPAGVEIPFDPLPLALTFLAAALLASRAAFLAGELQPGLLKVLAAARVLVGFIVIVAAAWVVIAVAQIGG